MAAKTIAGRYELEAELGSGGMGTVYRARDIQSQTIAAVKQLKPDVADSELIERFRREGEALRELKYRNTVTIMPFYQKRGCGTLFHPALALSLFGF